MKLRIRGNSLRLRLTKEEVARLGESGSVEDSIAFGAGTDKELLYRLETSATGQDVLADFRNGQIIVQIPRKLVEDWATTDEVSIEATQPLDNNAKLRILVEKDFACLKPRDGEDDRDAFAHPQGNEEC